MIALQITDVGIFMNSLLKGTMFDHFLLQETTISQAVSYTIDGSLNKNYFSDEELEDMELENMTYLPFSHLRPICFELLKGKKKPGYFKFIFLLSPKNQESTIAKSGSSFHSQDVRGMYLNLTYKNNMLTCTTGISYNLFSMDKTLDREWDRLVQLFFKQHGIDTELLG
jgi:hypothetical protein